MVPVKIVEEVYLVGLEECKKGINLLHI